MSLRDIGPTSGKWTRFYRGERREASYRIDTQKSGGFLPVIHWRHEQRAEQQSFLPSCDTQQEAAAAAERILAQLGYRPEGSNMTRQATRAHALRELFLIREQLQRLKEQCQPLSYSLAQQLNICLHSVRTAEGEFGRHYIPEVEQ